MTNQPSMDDQFLSTIHRIIEENMDDENFSVEQLAQKAGISRSMLHRKLVKLTGKSASEYITEERLNRANELLENNVATASEVAYRVGFNSPSYFNTVFKKRFGISPGKLRKGAVIPLEKNNNYQNRYFKKSNHAKTVRMPIILLILMLTLTIAGGGLYFILHENKSNENSIAILPFDNLSPDKENQYFADGIVEDLINRLSIVNNLKVISRTSSEMFRNKGSKTIPEIAEVLGVNYIMEGSIQREDENIRIHVQLIDAHTDDHIFSRQYNRKQSEFFRLQSDIAEKVVSEMAMYLTDRELSELHKNQTVNLKAFNYYHIGLSHLSKESVDEYNGSIDYFNKAIKEDDTYALAYLGKAAAYYKLAWQKWVDDDLAIRNEAEKLAKEALRIDDNLADAYALLGAIYMELDCNLKAAETKFLKALEKTGNSYMMYKEYAEFLSIIGKSKEARQSINKAIELNPLSFEIRHVSTMMYYMERDFKKAFEENSISLEIIKDHPWGLDRRFFICLALGNDTAAYKNLRKLSYASTYTEEEVDSAFRNSGVEGLIKLRLDSYEWYPGKANCYLLLGENEKAIEILEYALKYIRLRPFELFQVDSRNIESYPRFLSLKRKLGLENY